MERVEISDKALKSCDNSAVALSELLNSEMDYLSASIIARMRWQLHHRLEEELGYLLDDYILTKVLASLDENDYKGIKLCQLDEWQFISDDNGSIIREIDRNGSKFYYATLVKYCNFTFDRIILDKFKSILGE